ncbi:hypothetical protein [Sphingobium chungbukense]|uniref:Uncharacterized protein n=1 Tax=Sphingobium chungbukense TaxID=56193 RepID=A0A0M3AVR8_9SPHN|nr:hypothetical protein [Sphingobium chungbukense]KKW93940.1 hypothetical protein YP76_04685 [Sphingobium chungbukense]
MSEPLDLAQRLDDCWLDIIAPDAEAATFARCANLMQEAAKLLRSLGIPGDPAFECMAHDAHCPSGTARFAHLPDAPEYQYD